MDNYSFAAPCRQPPPFACLPSCLLLPPSTFRLPPAVSRLPPAVSFHPCALAICRPTAPHKPLHPSRDGQKKCDPKVALENFQEPYF